MRERERERWTRGVVLVYARPVAPKREKVVESKSVRLRTKEET
jgi:hypothetical protein